MDGEKTGGVDIPDEENGIAMLSLWRSRRTSQRNFLPPKEQAQVLPRLKVRRQRELHWMHPARPKATMTEAASDGVSSKVEERAKEVDRAVATQVSYSLVTTIRTIWQPRNVPSVGLAGTLETKSRWDWVEHERKQEYAVSNDPRE